MATMFNIKINFSKIDKTKLVKGKTGDMWGTVTGCIYEEVDQYGNNLATWFEQSKEERDAKTNRSYMGNGKAFWCDGKLTVVSKDNPDGKTLELGGSAEVKAEPVTREEDMGLPF
jgi:hypothetical protein